MDKINDGPMICCAILVIWLCECTWHRKQFGKAMTSPMMAMDSWIKINSSFARSTIKSPGDFE
jgi:hypothetical protein